MSIEHLSPDVPPEAIAKVLEHDACVVVDRLASPELMDEITT